MGISPLIGNLSCEGSDGVYPEACAVEKVEFGDEFVVFAGCTLGFTEGCFDVHRKLSDCDNVSHRIKCNRQLHIYR